MTKHKRGLGKGLNELLSASLGSQMGNAVAEPVQTSSKSTVPTDQALRYVPIDQLTPGPFQPRQQIRHEGLEQLAESIRAQGVLQPMVVRARGNQYEIVAGERRWRAARLAGLSVVPAIVREVSDEAAMAMALIENIQREDLNPIEEAAAMKRLADTLQLTHLQVAEAVGKSRASVTNLLRLLSLNADVQAYVENGDLEMGHARALLSLKGNMQSQMAETVVHRGLSVRETERLVSKLQEGKPESTEAEPVTTDPNIRRLQDDLADKLGAPVVIRHGRKGHGMLVIRYNDVDELEGILSHIK